MYDVAGAAAGTTALPEVFTSTLSGEIPWFGPETFTDVSTMDAAPFWPSTGVVANVGYQQSSYASKVLLINKSDRPLLLT